MGWTEHTFEYYVKINPTRNKFSTGILCALRFKTVWEILQCYLTFNEIEGFGPAVKLILYDANKLRGGEIMQNLLYNCMQNI